MKKPPAPAVTPQELAAAAGRKARRVQRKLHQAETEMHSANEALLHGPHAPELDEAVQRNAEAERKVHEAVEELEVMKEMLRNGDAHPHPRPHGEGPSGGKSGAGVRSLLPHLKRST
jgi:hypothetical protein